MTLVSAQFPQFTGMVINHYTKSAGGRTSIEVHPSFTIGIGDDEVRLNGDSIGHSKALKKISDSLAKGQLEVGQGEKSWISYPQGKPVAKKAIIADETLQRRLLGIIQNLVTTPKTYDRVFHQMTQDDADVISPVELYHTIKTRLRDTITDGMVPVRRFENEPVQFILNA